MDELLNGVPPIKDELVSGMTDPAIWTFSIAIL